MPLTNGGGRIMKKDIRFLVTNSCNYGCYFCHAEGVSGTLGKNGRELHYSLQSLF